MAPSETSATGSMITRLVEHTPACDGVVANDMVYGAFAVTMTMGTNAPNLTDLMGGCVVVVAAAAEREVHRGCTLAEDAVMLLGQSAQGIYVLRGLRAAE
jgi:hypothetical protein